MIMKRKLFLDEDKDFIKEFLSQRQKQHIHLKVELHNTLCQVKFK
jgi:hypothetical protein